MDARAVSKSGNANSVMAEFLILVVLAGLAFLQSALQTRHPAMRRFLIRDARTAYEASDRLIPGAAFTRADSELCRNVCRN